MAEDNDVETVKIVDEPIKTEVKADAAQPSAPQPQQATGEDKGTGEGEGQGEGFFDKLRGKLGEPVQEGLKKAVNKIRIKLNKFGTLIAETEQFIYEKYKLNQLMSPEEIHAEKAEIVEDVNLVLETRIKLFSAYGDIINVVFDILSHVVTRAFRFYRRKNGNNPKEEASWTGGTGGEGDPWADLSKQTGFSPDELRAASGRE